MLILFVALFLSMEFRVGMQTFPTSRITLSLHQHKSLLCLTMAEAEVLSSAESLLLCRIETQI